MSFPNAQYHPLSFGTGSDEEAWQDETIMSNMHIPMKSRLYGLESLDSDCRILMMAMDEATMEIVPVTIGMNVSAVAAM